MTFDELLELLEKHQVAEYSWGIEGCICDKDTGDSNDQARHRAKVLADALGIEHG